VRGIAGKVCVVTGASSGIGEATARALAAGGADVVLAARREERIVEDAHEIRSNGWNALAVRCDVTSLTDVENLVSQTERKFGRCDVLVNNAGIPGGGTFENLTLDQIERVTATNYLGVLRCTKLFLPAVLASRGHIVNVASIAGRYAFPGSAVYTAAKHALVGLSESLYHELAPRGVMVTSVNPGLVATEGFPMRDLLRSPYRRFVMKPDRIAAVIVDVIRRRKGPEVSVPRWLGGFQLVRLIAPPLYRGAVARIARRRAPSG
jgi:NAD(P)-dependent dehydrogenase (short-subunit alcohol dehydrogenase family)